MSEHEKQLIRDFIRTGGIDLDSIRSDTPSPASQENGETILDSVKLFIRRYVHLSDHQAVLVAVWVAHTHAVHSATITPYLNISSVVKQCGKTRLLEVLELLVAKPWLTGRVTSACLVRKIDEVSPTLLLDESDAAFNGEKEYAEALRGILNTGFSSDGVASCCVGQGANISYKDFRTYCAKAIAGIGQLPDTVADRSIPIRLQRKRPGEVVERFRRRKIKAEAAKIRGRLSTWIFFISERLKDAEPLLPEQLSDRQQDGIEPLLAIAHQAGGPWMEAVRNAAVEIFRSQAAEDQNLAMQLLSDIRSVFDEVGERHISSVDLLAKLKAIETSPWEDWSKGKGLTPNGLGRLLKPFGISSRTIRVEERTPKGYSRECFEEAFSRYLPPSGPRSDIPSATPPQPAYSLNETDFSKRNTKANVADGKSASNPHKQCIVADVADKDPLGEGVAAKKLTRSRYSRYCWEEVRHEGEHGDWFSGPDGQTCGRCYPFAKETRRS